MKGSLQRDIFGGLAVVAVGGAFALGAGHLQIGTVTKMGGGYFPLGAAVLTILFGVAIMLRAVVADRAARPDNTIGGVGLRNRVAWRAALAILGAVIMFAVGLTYLGFIPAVFACALFSAFADKASHPLETLVLAGVTACGSWAVFVYGLDIAAPAFVWGF